MNKVYNKSQFDDFLNKYNMTKLEFKRPLKTLRKKLSKVENINQVYKLCNNKKEFIRKFFPVTIESLTDYKTLCFSYDIEINKIRWQLEDYSLDKNRSFRVSQSNEQFNRKVKDNINLILAEAKRELEKMSGYWLVDGYISDLNKHGNKYREIKDFGEYVIFS